MTNRNALNLTRLFLVAALVAAFTAPALGEIDIPSLPYKPPAASQVVAGFMAAMLTNKDLSAEQRAEVITQLQDAQGDRDALTTALTKVYPQFGKALATLADEETDLAVPMLQELAKSADPYLAAHAEFYLARGYIMQDHFEEAMPLLRDLAGPAKADKTLYAGEALFYKGVTQDQLLKSSDALLSLATFVRQNPNAPERLLVGAQHMIDELQLMEPGSLFDVQGRMDFSRRRLSLKYTDEPVTQKEQGTIIAMLDKLIEEAEKKENEGGGGGGGGGQGQGQGQGPPSGNNPPSSPATKSTAPEGAARQGPLHRVTGGDEAESWGNLKDRKREEVMNAFNAKMSARYRKAIEEYYKSIQSGAEK